MHSKTSALDSLAAQFGNLLPPDGTEGGIANPNARRPRPIPSSLCRGRAGRPLIRYPAGDGQPHPQQSAYRAGRLPRLGQNLHRRNPDPLVAVSLGRCCGIDNRHQAGPDRSPLGRNSTLLDDMPTPAGRPRWRNDAGPFSENRAATLRRTVHGCGVYRRRNPAGHRRPGRAQRARAAYHGGKRTVSTMPYTGRWKAA